MLKNKRIFRGSTIGGRLMLFIISAVLLPTAVVLAFVFVQFNNIILSSLLESQVVTSLQAAGYISNTTARLRAICNTIIEDERLPVVLAGRDYSVHDEDDAAYYAAAQVLSAVIDSHISSNALSEIRIFSDMPFDSDGSISPLVSDVSEIRNTFWYGIFTTTDIDTFFAPEFYLSSAEREAHGNLAVIRRQIFEIGENQVTVFVAVYIYDDILAKPIRDIELESVEGIIAFIINSRETVVAQTDETAYGIYAMHYDEIALAIAAEGVFIQKDVAGTSVFMTYRDIESTDWRLAWIVPQASIVAQSRPVLVQLVLIFSLMTIVALIIGIIISKTIVGRIKSLRNQMQQIKTDRPEPLSLMPGKDEVGELIETYNYMVKRINTLLDDTIESAEELNNVKIKALRAQIDPHFLYNTLDMIKWLVKAGNNEKASDAIVALSRFYRLTLNRGNLSATVAAELEHVALYVKLMNMRFDDKIEYLVDMPDDMLEYEIPLIIFQPIVENAILHGIFEKQSKIGKIIITGWSDEETLYFLISDDGIGMTAQQLSLLMLNENENEMGNGIGVYNTHRRLQLMYDRDDCGLQYSSEYGKGTDVTFRIPKQKRYNAAKLAPEDDFWIANVDLIDDNKDYRRHNDE